MAYCDISDINKLIGSHSLAVITGDSTGETVNSDRLNYAINFADKMIDGYLFSIYDVPFTDVPPLINKLSAQGTIIYLYQIYMFESDIPQLIKDMYKEFLSTLNKIRAGDIRLSGYTYKGFLIATKKSNEENAISNSELNNFQL